MIITLELSDIAIRPDLDPASRLTLNVDAGEVVAISGPPKFGGTTIARMVAGHVRPATGQIKLHGHDISEVEPRKRAVGFVPVDGCLLPQRTLEQNITYGARLADRMNDALRERLAELVEKLELQPSMELLPHEAAAEHRVGAALARAELKRPQTLVIDATSGATGLTTVRQMIARIWGEPASLPVLLCTRNNDVARQADRIVWVEDGRVAIDAPIAELRAAPPTLSIAMLVLDEPTRVDRVVHDGVVTLSGPTLSLPGTTDGQDVVVVLTKDSLEAALPEDTQPTARVVAPWDVGARHIWVEPLDRPGERWPARSAAGRHLQEKERVTLRLGPQPTFVFDARTGALVEVAS